MKISKRQLRRIIREEAQLLREINEDGSSSGNPVVDGAVVGIGVGLIGSLLVGKVLESQKNNCHYRYKRDGASTR